MGSKKVIDIGCGAGSSTYFLAKEYSDTTFLGLDISEDLISLSKNIVAEKKLLNIDFIVDDWFELNNYEQINGVISIQTLSWLSEFEIPLIQIFEKINPSGISFTSLFYEGDISLKTEVLEHINNKACFNNHYSIPAIERLSHKYGYKIADYKPFEIDIDIDKPVDLNYMSTYTIKTEKEKRIQVSGPMLMNWYFLTIIKA
jgi:trans-aconitate methyltransferase